MKYVKGNFLPTRHFRDLANLNAQAKGWMLDEAGRRKHGTTLQQPLVLFELERPLMRRLPAAAPDLGTWRKVGVHRDCHVQFERAYYSAPFTLVGKTLWLRATDTTVALYGTNGGPAYLEPSRQAGDSNAVVERLPDRLLLLFRGSRGPARALALGAGPRPSCLVARCDQVALEVGGPRQSQHWGHTANSRCRPKVGSHGRQLLR